jgi:hypothetical protein
MKPWRLTFLVFIVISALAIAYGAFLIRHVVEIGHGVYRLAVNAQNDVARFELLGRGTARIDVANNDAANVGRQLELFSDRGSQLLHRDIA